VYSGFSKNLELIELSIGYLSLLNSQAKPGGNSPLGLVRSHLDERHGKDAASKKSN
jgi:hypothetical protein